MALTSAEKAAGRLFRAGQKDELARRNLAELPDGLCSPYGPPYLRHMCGEKKGTVALALKTRKRDSPAYVVSGNGGAEPVSEEQAQVFRGVIAAREAGTGLLTAVIPAGRFSWVWLEGRCSSCSYTARSSSGYIIVNEEDDGGREAGPHPGNT